MKYISLNDELLGIIQIKCQNLPPSKFKQNIVIYTSQQATRIPIDILEKLNIDYTNFIKSNKDVIVDDGVMPQGTDDALKLMKNMIYSQSLGEISEKYEPGTFQIKKQEKIIPVHFSILDVCLTTFTLSCFGWFTSISRQKSPTYTATATVVCGFLGLIIDTILWFIKGNKINLQMKK
ncbi:Transmembrane domain-containing protein [Spironucleus salmonicida]|uniref:Transmembrane domain-containing protein n=1 Tax=Spironucleus salmonicida TaxID=348837 RepID=V6LCM7_9EUKA|nr:Transmembrane domain-containing protein [Spironucleus salmonicida]|eukprot:EST42235.1 Transmembrane domain-containing protein [Spironucleus salmonicida]